MHSLKPFIAMIFMTAVLSSCKAKLEAHVLRDGDAFCTAYDDVGQRCADIHKFEKQEDGSFSELEAVELVLRGRGHVFIQQSFLKNVNDRYCAIHEGLSVQGSIYGLSGQVMSDAMRQELEARVEKNICFEFHQCDNQLVMVAYDEDGLQPKYNAAGYYFSPENPVRDDILTRPLNVDEMQQLEPPQTSCATDS